jgi:hypothetical protein
MLSSPLQLSSRPSLSLLSPYVDLQRIYRHPYLQLHLEILSVHKLAGIIYHPTILIKARLTSLVLAVFEELSVSETSVSSIDKAIVP